MPRIRHAGFAMIDVLVALLLLAITLTGACATLVAAQRSTHSALLATRAVDLAADLAEELHTVTSITEIDALVAAWRGRASAELPVAGMEPDQFASLTQAAAQSAATSGGVPRHELTLRWHDGRAGGVRQLTMPVAAPFAEASP
jgi:Tfp pilus assembly protein PilV